MDSVWTVSELVLVAKIWRNLNTPNELNFSSTFIILETFYFFFLLFGGRQGNVFPPPPFPRHGWQMLLCTCLQRKYDVWLQIHCERVATVKSHICHLTYLPSFLCLWRDHLRSTVQTSFKYTVQFYELRSPCCASDPQDLFILELEVYTLYPTSSNFPTPRSLATDILLSASVSSVSRSFVEVWFCFRFHPWVRSDGISLGLSALFPLA